MAHGSPSIGARSRWRPKSFRRRHRDVAPRHDTVGTSPLHRTLPFQSRKTPADMGRRTAPARRKRHRFNVFYQAFHDNLRELCESERHAELRPFFDLRPTRKGRALPRASVQLGHDVTVLRPIGDWSAASRTSRRTPPNGSPSGRNAKSRASKPSISQTG